MQNILTYLFLVLTVQLTFAQKVKVEGTLKGATTKEIYLYPDKSYGEFEKMIIPIYQRGIFSFEVDVTHSQIAILGWNGHYLRLFLTPDTQINIDADAIIFPQGVNFSGSGGYDSYFLQEYFRVEPPVREFNKQYYKIFGHQFPFTTQIEGYMGLYHPDDYQKRLEGKQAKVKLLLSNPIFAKTTDDFQRFLHSEIDGFNNYSLLSYSLLYSKREGIPTNYFHLETLPTGDINSEYYRQYLILNNLYMASLSEGDNPRAQTCYRLAEVTEEGKAKEYLLSEIILDAVRKGDEETLMLFEEFLNSYPESPFLKKIDQVIYKDLKKFYGEKAKDFYLMNIDGSQTALSQYKGKIIHIDFWASWCKPCLTKMEKLETIKNENDDIVFITISIDRDTQSWKQSLKRHSFSGVHLYAGKNSTIVQDYGVKGVPAEFIIKKNGEFVSPPEDSDPKILFHLLTRLANAQ